MRSVLIICDEYPFLLSSYSWLRHDARIGRIEATTSQKEALSLAVSYHPDVVVFDATSVGEPGLTTIRRLHDIDPGTDIVVTFDARCSECVKHRALESGAVGVLSRERFTAEACLKLAGVPAPRPPESDEPAA